MSPYDSIEHIVEWLNWSIRSDVHWIRRLDKDGNIRKLMKLGSIPAMVNEANKSIAKLQEGHYEPESIEDHLEVMKLADGFRVVRLLSPKALRNETASMQHCVGLGGYDERVLSKEHAFYSLRDSRGRSHATIYVMLQDGKWTIREMRGKQNRMAILKYRKIILPFLDENHFEIGAAATHAGILVAENNHHYPYDDFPTGMKVRDLDISQYREADMRDLPPFSRNLIVRQTTLKNIPEGYEFQGNLDLRGNSLTSLPRGLHIRGDLDLSWTLRIKALPEDLVVDGNIILSMSKVRHIPSSTKFGTLKAGGIPIHLPEGGKFDGSLDLAEEYGHLAIPKNLHIKGDLNLAGLALVSLPDGLIVEGELDISRTRIKHLPADLQVRHLIAQESDIQNLRRSLYIPGNLDISGTKISHLPKGLSVGGDLVLADTDIHWIPGGTRIGGDIVLDQKQPPRKDIWDRSENKKKPKRIRLSITSKIGGIHDKVREPVPSSLRSRLLLALAGKAPTAKK